MFLGAVHAQRMVLDQFGGPLDVDLDKVICQFCRLQQQPIHLFPVIQEHLAAPNRCVPLGVLEKEGLGVRRGFETDMDLMGLIDPIAVR